ncbi:MAG: creatininase family protein [Candidatus Aminicenantes bacterium]|nr:MAG: creatininase family protein [Candidatus Aminicenantes bacterium]
MSGINFKRYFILLIVFFCVLGVSGFGAGNAKALVLQEMSWLDVKEYLKTNDMVIIPLGATEQHGPHLPLGSDYYEAFGISKIISEKTGVVVVQVLFVGYSIYHSGFPGTLSIKPETMEKVLFETVEVLLKYGFRRFMFLNYHGGNNIVQDNVIHRINHSTKGIAVAIGIGNSIQKEDEGDFFDWHSGKSETSIMLYLRPDLVRMDRAEKPVITFTPQMKELRELSKKYPELMHVWQKLFGVPAETAKGGASHELSSNGVWSFSHPRTASKKIGEESVKKMVDTAVSFINAWKKVK